MKRLVRLSCAGLAMMLAACGATDPYVFREGEFDRDADDFNQPILDRDFVTICYNGWATDDLEVVAMAETECAKFGKVAQARIDRLGQCPLFTPGEAEFACVSP